MSKVNYGHAHFRFGDKRESVEFNHGPSSLMRNYLYKVFVNSGETIENVYDGATPGFGRFSKLRPYRSDVSMIDSALSYGLGVDSAWISGTPNRDYNCYQDNRNSEVLPTDGGNNDPPDFTGEVLGLPCSLALSNDSMAVGSIHTKWGREGSLSNDLAPPDGAYGEPLISFLDVPGTVVGNKFKHPTDRNHLFNEAGQVATSQGDLSVLGVFEPAENVRYHTSYQVYITKSGGTGDETPTASGSDGNTIAPNIFDSTGFDFTGHTGKYIKITDGKTGANVGCYLITGISGNNAVTDASTINEAFTTYSGGDIVWELVVGPIAEYFVRRRRYRRFGLWDQLVAGSSDTFNRILSYMYDKGLDVVPNTTKMPPIINIHDRGAHWWTLCHNVGSTSYGPYCLIRYMDEGPYPVNYPYLDGEITGGMPSGIKSWRHMAIDKNDKIWIVADDTGDAVGKSVYRIDPYPLDGGEPNSLEPELLNSLTKQASLAAAGLPSLAAMGVVCDEINGDSTHGRTWVICGDDGSINGGLWYSEDGGSTMEGLVHEKSVLTGTDNWNVAADGVTVSNPAADASLTTEVVAGEWITFEDGEKDESKRQIASVTDDDTLVLTAATGFGGSQSGLSMKKGAIDSAYIGLRFVDTLPDDWNREERWMPPGVDHDTDGRLYWIPFDYSQLGIVRFDPDSTDPLSFIAYTDLRRGLGTFDWIEHLLVSRMPDPLGFGDSVWNDNVWVGGGYSEGASRVYAWETYTNTGVATVTVDEFSDSGRAFTDDDIGKYIRIYKSASGNDGTYEITGRNGTAAVCSGAGFTTESNICWELFGVTRYYNSTTDNFPETVVYNPNSAFTVNSTTVQDRINGDIFLIPQGIQGIYNNGTRVSRVLTCLPESDTNFGLLSIETGNWGFNVNANMPGMAVKFDTLGMGTAFTFQWNGNHTAAYVQGRHVGPHWCCLLWDGSDWVQAPFNGIDANLDFAGTPLGEKTLSVGNGLRRAFDQPQELEHGLWLRWDQAGGGTGQTNEFVVNENITWVCAVGRIKDNTMTAEYLGTHFKLPTVTRIDEVGAEIGSPWTVVGGWDGGYVEDPDDQEIPNPMRGIAECQGIWSDGTATNYASHQYGATATTDNQWMCQLRIHDETIPDETADLTLVNNAGGGSDGGATSATYDFDNDDIGKTIRVENATGANNTAKVIVDVDNPGGGAGTSRAVLDSTWAAGPEGPVDWRLRDIPQVHHVAWVGYCEDRVLFYCDDWTLLSSRDGINWDVVKEASAMYNPSDEALISSYRDPGIMQGGPYWTPISKNFTVNGGTSHRRYLQFDLSDLTSDQRRRTWWKVIRNKVNAPSNYGVYIETMLLLDANYAPVLATGLMASDRLDPLFFGMRATLRAIVHESSGTVSITKSQTMPFSYGDIVNESGSNYWLQNSTDLKTFANTSYVYSNNATFTWQDVGRKLRVPAADITLGVEETYSGFLTIVALIDANTVEVERTFESQSAGTFTAVGDDGGGKCRFTTSSAHGLAVGDAVTIDGVTGTWDGIHRVTNVSDSTHFDTNVTYGSGTDTGTWDEGQQGLTWATLNFGATDYVRFEDATTVYPNIGKPLQSVTYEIIDVPSDTEIQVAYMDIPTAVGNTPFEVERKFDTLFNDRWAYTGYDLEDGEFNAFYSQRHGIFGVSDEAQFNVIDSDTSRSAGTAADGDGDGWQDTVTLTGHNITNGAAGDWLLLYSPSTEADDDIRRWYMVKSITPGTNTVIVTEEDEIRPSETFKWKLCRKRDMKMRLVSAIVSGREPI